MITENLQYCVFLFSMFIACRLFLIFEMPLKIRNNRLRVSPQVKHASNPNDGFFFHSTYKKAFHAFFSAFSIHCYGKSTGYECL